MNGHPIHYLTSTNLGRQGSLSFLLTPKVKILKEIHSSSMFFSPNFVHQLFLWTLNNKSLWKAWDLCQLIFVLLLSLSTRYRRQYWTTSLKPPSNCLQYLAAAMGRLLIYHKNPPFLQGFFEYTIHPMGSYQPSSPNPFDLTSSLQFLSRHSTRLQVTKTASVWSQQKTCRKTHLHFELLLKG